MKKLLIISSLVLFSWFYCYFMDKDQDHGEKNRMTLQSYFQPSPEVCDPDNYCKPQIKLVKTVKSSHYIHDTEHELLFNKVQLMLNDIRYNKVIFNF